MSNRERYESLLKQHKISQTKSAELIEAVTQRPLAARTVRSWLNNPDGPSSRPCPDWAVAALEKAIYYMQRYVEQRKQAEAEGECSKRGEGQD